MATQTNPGSPPGDTSKTEVARQEASNVGQSTTQAAGEVGQVTKEQAKQVVGEAGQQARDLAAEARGQLRAQADSGRERVAGGLRAVGDELDQMAERGGQSGVATEIARQISQRCRDAARYVEDREPGQLVEQVRSFARDRSGTFLLGAVLAGVVAGRLTRAATAGSDGQQESPGTASDWTAREAGADDGMAGYRTPLADPGYPAGTGQPGYPPGTGQSGSPADADQYGYRGVPDAPGYPAAADQYGYRDGAAQPAYPAAPGEPVYGGPAQPVPDSPAYAERPGQWSGEYAEGGPDGPGIGGYPEPEPRPGRTP